MVYVYSTMKIALQTKIGVFHEELGARRPGQSEITGNQKLQCRNLATVADHYLRGKSKVSSLTGARTGE
jgi:hypothetical protein